MMRRHCAGLWRRLWGVRDGKGEGVGGTRWRMGVTLRNRDSHVQLGGVGEIRCASVESMEIKYEIDMKV